MKASMKKSSQMLLSFSLLLACCSYVFAQQEKRQDQSSELGLGIRAGLGLEPDQFVIGAQFSLEKKLGIARVVPSIDLGFGDNVTTIILNADFLFRLKVEETGYGFYGGAGPTLSFWDFEKSNDEWKPGISAIAGVHLPLFPKHTTNLEARFGIGSIPDFRLLLAFIL
jgi:hypothetical protein